MNQHLKKMDFDILYHLGQDTSDIDAIKVIKYSSRLSNFESNDDNHVIRQNIMMLKLSQWEDHEVEFVLLPNTPLKNLNLIFLK